MLQENLLPDLERQLGEVNERLAQREARRQARIAAAGQSGIAPT
jgi:hypothetical protein